MSKPKKCEWVIEYVEEGKGQTPIKCGKLREECHHAVQSDFNGAIFELRWLVSQLAYCYYNRIVDHMRVPENRNKVFDAIKIAECGDGLLERKMLLVAIDKLKDEGLIHDAVKTIEAV